MNEQRMTEVLESHLAAWDEIAPLEHRSKPDQRRGLAQHLAANLYMVQMADTAEFLEQQKQESRARDVVALKAAAYEADRELALACANPQADPEEAMAAVMAYHQCVSAVEAAEEAS